MNARFLDPLDYEYLGPDRWRLHSELRYESPILGGRFGVPAGFVTDQESVSRWFPLVYALLKGEAARAAVVHDYLYRTHLGGMARKAADAILYEAARADGVARWRAWLLWAGVRVGGQWAWETGPRRYTVLSGGSTATVSREAKPQP